MNLQEIWKEMKSRRQTILRSYYASFSKENVAKWS